MARGGRKYARDARGRFASVGATARGGRLKKASGKRATVKTKSGQVSQGKMSGAPLRGTIGATAKARQNMSWTRPASAGQRQAYNAARAGLAAKRLAQAAPKSAPAPKRISIKRPAGAVANKTGSSRQLNRYNSRPVTTRSQSLDQYAAKRGVRPPSGIAAIPAIGAPFASTKAQRGKINGQIRRQQKEQAAWDLAGRKYKNAVAKGVVRSTTRNVGLDVSSASDRAYGRVATKRNRMRRR